MITLSREIRFALVSPDHFAINEAEQPIANSWAGWPSTNLIVPQLVLRCEVAGEPDPLTGYLCNIKVLDQSLRQIVTEKIVPHFDGTQSAELMLQTVFQACQSDQTVAAPIVAVTLAVSPYLFFTIRSEEPAMIQLTQQFEFSAAHRLHCDRLSIEENRKVFGKCNNLEGHGHNYVVEVTVARAVDWRADDASNPVIGLAEFEAIVKRLVIDRLDHKHLNRDIEYFATVNPSVENISIAIFDWLVGQFGAARLVKVRVYETPKTWAEYGG